MGPRQSLSEVVGTHVVLACKWIITVFYTREMRHTDIEQGAGGLTFVEIQRFCGICPKTFETVEVYESNKKCRLKSHFPTVGNWLQTYWKINRIWI